MGGWGSGRRRSSKATTLDYLELDVRRLQHDGLLDLFVPGYVKYDVDHPPRGGKPCQFRGVNVFCGPQGLPDVEA